MATRPNKPPVITLTTDFGVNDYFVGTMKGVILSINPEITLVDITHTISPFQIMEGAFLLGNFYSFFPKKTIHLTVVDPGVGSRRRAIVAKTSDYLFVAPDNGVLSYIYKKEKDIKVYEITNNNYFLKPVSQTFHGRDIFAPIAAYLSKGVSPDRFGSNIKDFICLSVKEPVVRKNFIIGDILYSDHFGNLITNISSRDFKSSLSLSKQKIFQIRVNNFRVKSISDSYSSGKANVLSAIWGSHGNLEFFLKNGSASSRFKIKPGGKITISFL